MDLPAYMVGVGTFLAGAAGLASLIVKRGQRDDADDELVAYLKAQLDECEQRERDRSTPPTRKRRST